MRKIFTITTILVALIWCSSLFAQEGSKDQYEGQYKKQELTPGQNIPLPHNLDFVTLYDNGPLTTHPGGGFGGADASALQTALGMGTYGYGHQITAGLSIADDFTISGAAWNIDAIEFFAYQTGSSTTSTFTDYHVQIYDGDPSAGGSVIWGDLSTNVLSATTWTNIYRVLDTDLLASNRPIMVNTVNIVPALNLSAGTYWIEWQAAGTLGSGPWAPAVTVLGSTGTGNALQNTGAWAPAMDVGPQDFPFIIYGDAGPPCPIDPPTDPDPADGAIDVDINLAALSWTNGAGANNVEVWFEGAMVYDGTAISTWPIPGPLVYSTTYTWKVVGKNDTCAVSGPNWTFTTMDDPLIVCLFTDEFPSDISLWTEVGPTGIGNWLWSATNTAGGGAAGELMFSWSPQFVGDSYIMSPVIPSAGLSLFVNFNHMVDYFGAGLTVGCAYTLDGGTTWTTIWDVVDPPGNVGPELVQLTSIPGDANFQLGFFYSGDSFQIDFWYVDDVFVCYIIPVELTSFTAAVKENEVTLNWVTATETNNQGFEIERNSGSGFQNIGYVAGFGTSTEIHSYSFVDASLNQGSYSYRLKQVDLDGTFEYSDVVEVDVTVPDVFALEQNYPNPFNPSTKIDFSLAVDSKVSLKVFDVLGQEVATLINTNLVAGSHNVDFNAASINSGVYFYRIEATGIDGTNFTNVKKMILTK